MRAIVHHTFGEPADVLTVEEVATPDPQAGEVRLRILLATIHNHDLMTVRGVYGFKPELPARAGTEAVGIVDAIGEGVEGLEVGQRVVANTFGVWAEYVTLPAKGLSPLPDAGPDEVAAQLFAMPFSAITLLDFLQVEPGAWVVQNAANGAVGRVFARLAATRGVNVIGLVRRADGVAELASEGIERVVATGDIASLLGQGGVLVVFGAMASGTMHISSSDILFKDVTVKGFWGSKVGPSLSPERRGALVAELQARIADGTVSLPVASVHPFDDVAGAARASDTPGRVGKVLLRP